MTLASLIIGCAEAEGAGGEPRAALPFLGQCLVEYQARLAAAAGAKHIVILVERVPAALVGAVDRLKRDGVAVEIARTVADAADRIHPEERLLVIGDGVIAREDLVRRAGRAVAPSLFTIPDSNVAGAHERIDAGARWAGLALIEGGALRRTAAMLGDWDLQSTLLRRVVQAHPTRIEISSGAVWLIERREDGRPAEVALLGGEMGRVLPAPLIERGSAVLLGPRMRLDWLRIGALGLAAAAVPAFANGWTIAGAAALVASGPAAAMPQRVDRAGLKPEKWERLWRGARDIVFGAAVLVLAYRLAAIAGWGVWPLAIGNIGLVALLSDQARLGGADLASPALLALIFLLFALFGAPVWGLAATALVAAVALGWGQRRLVRTIADPGFVPPGGS